MPSNKDRLYIALYARGGASKMPGGEDKYHWALLVGPKTEDELAHGQRFHAKESMSLVGGQEQVTPVWKFEAKDIDMAPSAMILVRIVIGKIKDQSRLVSILEQVPIRSNEKDWNCVEWVKEAIHMLQKDGKALGTAVFEWHKIRDSCLRYVQQKQAMHRFDGKAAPGKFDTKKVATWDLLEGTETVA